MNEQAVKVFIHELNLVLNFYGFDYVASIPMPFSDLARVNRVSDKAGDCLPGGYGMFLKDLLKPVEPPLPEPSVMYNFRQQERAEESLNACKRKSEEQDEESAKKSKQEVGSGGADDTEVRRTTEKINFDDNKVRDAIQHLNSFLEEDNLESLRKGVQQSRDEGELGICLGIHLFSKLKGKAYTNRKNSLRSCPCDFQEKLPDHENMWIGSENTWYGELDIIAGNPAVGDAVSIYVNNYEKQEGDEVSDEDEETEKDENEDEDASEFDYGDHKSVEVNWLISQAVVFAFTEYNSYSFKGNFIPSVLINKSYFQFVVYSPVDDVLFVSNHITYGKTENFERKTGFRPFVLLWIILNHRLFFKKGLEFRRSSVKSGFSEKIDNLQQFQHLNDYSKVIHLEQKFNFPDDTSRIITPSGVDWFLDN